MNKYRISILSLLATALIVGVGATRNATDGNVTESLQSFGPEILFGRFAPDHQHCSNNFLSFGDGVFAASFTGQKYKVVQPVEFVWREHKDGLGASGIWQFFLEGIDGPDTGDWLTLMADARYETVQGSPYNNRLYTQGMQIVGNVEKRQRVIEDSLFEEIRAPQSEAEISVFYIRCKE